MQALREHLLSLQDTKYQKFHSALCPGIDNIIGIRIPVLRKLANESSGMEITLLICRKPYTNLLSTVKKQPYAV